MTTPARAPCVGDIYEFAAPAEVTAMPGGAGDGPRKFKGTAYTGAVVHKYFAGGLIFDLAGMELPAKLPMLVDHETGRRAGWADKFKKSNSAGLVLEGQLMDTAAGTEVGDEADQGFPWQMSVRVIANAIEEVPEGAKVRVNGKSHVGPLTIFRTSRVRETSFTAVGADAATEAFVFSLVAGADEPPPPAAPPAPTNQPEDQAMELAQLQEQLDAEKAAREATEAKLASMEKQHADFVAGQRARVVQALLTEVGMEFNEANAKPYMLMDDAALEAVGTQMRAMHKAKADAQASAKPADEPVLPNWLKGDRATDGKAEPTESDVRMDALNGAIDALLKQPPSGAGQRDEVVSL